MKTFLFIFALILTTFVSSKPSCVATSKQFNLYVSLFNQINIQTTQLIQGYNMEYLINNQSYYYNLQRKENYQQRNHSISNIITTGTTINNNTFGQNSFIIYKDQRGYTMLNYRYFQNKYSLPSLKGIYLVAKDSSFTCFQAVITLEYGRVIVDCVKQDTQLNYFIFIDLVRNTSVSIQNTKQLNRIIRTYVNQNQQASETKSQIFYLKKNYPNQTKIIHVIDNKMTGIQHLNIKDTQIYQNIIYILDYETGIYGFNVIDYASIVLVEHLYTQNKSKFDIIYDSVQTKRYIYFSNHTHINKFVWNYDNKLEHINLSQIQLYNTTKINKLLANDVYTIVEGCYINQKSNKSCMIWVFYNHPTSLDETYTIISSTQLKSIAFSKSNDLLHLIYSTKQIIIKLIQSIAQNQYRYNFDQKTLTLTGTSIDFQTGQKMVCTKNINVKYVQYYNQLPIFTINTNKTIQINNNQAKIPLYSYFKGAIMEYRVKARPQLDYQVKTIQQISYQQKPKNINFLTSIQVQNYEDQMIMFSQDSNNILYIQYCKKQDSNVIVKNTIIVSNLSKIYLFQPLIVTKQANQIKNIHYVVVFQNKKSQFQIYNKDVIVNKMDFLLQQIQSMTSHFNKLYVLIKKTKQIHLFNIIKCLESYCSSYFIFGQKNRNALGQSPSFIKTSKWHPSLIFIIDIVNIFIYTIDKNMNVARYGVILNSMYYNNTISFGIGKQFVISTQSQSPSQMTVYNLSRRSSFGNNLNIYKSHIQYRYSSIQVARNGQTFFVKAKLNDNHFVLCIKPTLSTAISTIGRINLQTKTQKTFLYASSYFRDSSIFIYDQNRIKIYKIFQQPYILINNITQNKQIISVQAFNDYNTTQWIAFSIMAPQKQNNKFKSDKKKKNIKYLLSQ